MKKQYIWVGLVFAVVTLLVTWSRDERPSVRGEEPVTHSSTVGGDQGLERSPAALSTVAKSGFISTQSQDSEKSKVESSPNEELLALRERSNKVMTQWRSSTDQFFIENSVGEQAQAEYWSLQQFMQTKYATRRRAVYEESYQEQMRAMSSAASMDVKDRGFEKLLQEKLSRLKKNTSLEYAAKLNTILGKEKYEKFVEFRSNFIAANRSSSTNLNSEFKTVMPF